VKLVVPVRMILVLEVPVPAMSSMVASPVNDHVPVPRAFELASATVPASAVSGPLKLLLLPERVRVLVSVGFAVVR